MVTANIPMITWCAILAAMTILLVFRLFHGVHRHHRQAARHGKIFEVGSESEEFFIPGDPYPEHEK